MQRRRLLIASPAALAHLLKYDSVHGRFDGTVEVQEDAAFHECGQQGLEGLVALLRLRREELDRHAQLLAGGDLVAHVNGGGGILADQDEGEPRGRPPGAQRLGVAPA